MLCIPYKPAQMNLICYHLFQIFYIYMFLVRLREHPSSRNLGDHENDGRLIITRVFSQLRICKPPPRLLRNGPIVIEDA